MHSYAFGSPFRRIAGHLGTQSKWLTLMEKRLRVAKNVGSLAGPVCCFGPITGSWNWRGQRQSFAPQTPGFRLSMKESAWRALALSLAIGLLMTLHSALADSTDEKQKIARCAKDICSIIVSKNAKGPDLSCDLTKTWEREEIQKGADAKSLSWGLGSARCSVKLYAKRADIAAALTSPLYTSERLS